MTTSPSDPGERGPTPQYPIESVDNALRLLLLFESQPTIRLTEASRYLEVASSTAHRVLVMLQYRGFVRQNPHTKAYEPGRSLTSIAHALRGMVDISEAVRPALQELYDATLETVHFGELRGTDAYFILAIESPRAVRVASRQGASLPAHCSATGKAMLSRLPEDKILQLYPREELPALTAHTITSRRELLTQTRLAAKAGVSFSSEENEDGVMSVAAPLGGADERIFGVNVSVPSHRMNPAKRTELAQLVLRTARKIEGQIL